MPSNGINFSPQKSRTKSSALSSNPRTAATRKWERELGGLTLAVHRIAKASTVAKGRAIKKLKLSTIYAEADEATRAKLEKDVEADFKAKKAAKTKEARRTWRELHGEPNDVDDGSEGSMEVDEGRDADEGEDEAIAGSLDDDPNRDDDDEDEAEGAEYDSEDDSGDDDGDSAASQYSEAEEAPADEIDVGVDELSSVQQDELTARLFALRANQAREAMELIAKVEEDATTRKTGEMPDDFIFGYDS
jgi:hypothetical protein